MIVACSVGLVRSSAISNLDSLELKLYWWVRNRVEVAAPVVENVDLFLSRKVRTTYSVVTQKDPKHLGSCSMKIRESHWKMELQHAR